MLPIYKYSTQKDGMRFLRIQFTVPQHIVKRLKEEGHLVVDTEVQRDEVKKRVGNAEAYNQSAEDNISLGLFMGYSSMSLMDAVIACDRVVRYEDISTHLFTLETPMKVSEGGHRMRWLSDCEDSNSPITLTCLFGDEPHAVEMKARVEFRVVNTHHAPATAGEIVDTYAHEDARFEARRIISDHIDAYCPTTKSERGKRILVQDAVVNTLQTRDFDKLHTKKSIVDDSRVIEVVAEGVELVEKVFNELDAAMSHLRARVPQGLPEPESLVAARNAFGNARKAEKQAAKVRRDEEIARFKEENDVAKKFHAKVAKMQFDLKLYGPLLWGLLNHNSENMSAATDMIKRWFDLCATSTEVWDRQMKAVTLPAVSGSGVDHLTQSRFREGWNALCMSIA